MWYELETFVDGFYPTLFVDDKCNMTSKLLIDTQRAIMDKPCPKEPRWKRKQSSFFLLYTSGIINAFFFSLIAISHMSCGKNHIFVTILNFTKMKRSFRKKKQL